MTATLERIQLEIKLKTPSISVLIDGKQIKFPKKNTALTPHNSQ